jgi:hypothetical protein
MSTPVLPDVEVDERTIDELQAGCDVTVATVVRLAGAVAVRMDRCELPAEWIVRTTCRCGATEANLVCDPHVALVGTPAFVCKACRCRGAGRSSIEPIRRAP